MSHVVAVAPVLADHAYDQAEITATLGPLLTATPRRRALLDRVHATSGVASRHLALPLEKYAALGSFGQANDLFISIGAELAERAVRAGLAAAGLEPRDVDLLLFTTVTGVSAPSIDSLLVARLGMRPDVRRMPSFGLGCVAGAAGLARVHDHLVGHPEHVAVLLSVELCSLTLQHGDDSTANLVSSGLFGDGAAAVVMVGDAVARRSFPSATRVVGTRSALYPGSAGDLGWQVGASGFRIVLSPGLADLIERHVATDVTALLDEHGLSLGDVETWVAHPGGPRILDAAARALGLPHDALARSWSSLRRVGNLSSASVLHVLADTLAVGPGAPGTLRPGSWAVLFAFGPGVSGEVVLLSGPPARSPGPLDREA